MEQYRQQKKEKNLSRQFVSTVLELREHLNQTGQTDTPMVVAEDGSFCNRTVWAEDWQARKVALVVRCRKDIVLCKRGRERGTRFYGKTKFTPEQVRRWDGLAPWQSASIFVRQHPPQGWWAIRLPKPAYRRLEVLLLDYWHR